jgi:hypothetical protein
MAINAGQKRSVIATRTKTQTASRKISLNTFSLPSRELGIIRHCRSK